MKEDVKGSCNSHLAVIYLINHQTGLWEYVKSVGMLLNVVPGGLGQTLAHMAWGDDALPEVNVEGSQTHNAITVNMVLTCP